MNRPPLGWKLDAGEGLGVGGVHMEDDVSLFFAWGQQLGCRLGAFSALFLFYVFSSHWKSAWHTAYGIWYMAHDTRHTTDACTVFFDSRCIYVRFDESLGLAFHFTHIQKRRDRLQPHAVLFPPCVVGFGAYVQRRGREPCRVLPGLRIRPGTSITTTSPPHYHHITTTSPHHRITASPWNTSPASDVPTQTTLLIALGECI